MGPGGILHIAMTALGAAAAGGGFLSVGLPMAAAGAGALLGGVSVAAGVAVFNASRDRRAADQRFARLAEEMAQLRQQQAETESRLAEVSQRSDEAPALAWRAATADIQVLGSLVSDLAQAVASHDALLTAQVTPPMQETPRPEPSRSPPIQPATAFILPQTSPPPAAWFEDEAEPGSTTDGLPEQPAFQKQPAFPEQTTAHAAPATRPAASPASPAMVAELKSTLAAALMSDRLELCLQPCVTLPQRKVAGYEAALRLKGEDGELQSADDLRAAAAVAGMGRDLDRILIERSGQVLRVLRARERVISITCCVSGDSLRDAAFRSSVEQMVRGDGKLAQSIRLSVPLRDVATLQRQGQPALEALRRTGVSLGAVGGEDLNIDATLLEKLGITELRLRADVLLATMAQADIHPADMGEVLQRRGIELLVTGVTSEGMVRDLLDFAATTAQGDLFGTSRPVRPEVLQPRAVAEPSAAARIKSAKTAEQAPRPPRQSFRSLLRRA